MGIAFFLAPLAAEAGPGAAFENDQLGSETTCLGSAERAPDVWTEGGFRYAVAGGRAEVRSVAPREAKLGLLAAIEDFSPDTQANLKAFVAASAGSR